MHVIHVQIYDQTRIWRVDSGNSKTDSDGTPQAIVYFGIHKANNVLKVSASIRYIHKTVTFHFYQERAMNTSDKCL